MPRINLSATTARAARLEAEAYMRQHDIPAGRIISHVEESVTLSRSMAHEPKLHTERKHNILFQLEWRE